MHNLKNKLTLPKGVDEANEIKPRRSMNFQTIDNESKPFSF